MSNLIHKVKDALSSDKPSHTEGSTTTHHSTNTTSNYPQENQRVGQEGAGFAQPQSEGFATTGVQQPNRGYDGPATTTDGPHKSNLLNKADPRVDSDGDRSKNLGMNPHGTATTDSRRTEGTTATRGGTTHPHNTRSAGLAGENFANTDIAGTSGNLSATERSGGVPEGTYGHHNSRIANAADPRIDSDLDSRRTAGTTGSTTTGAVGDVRTTTGAHRHGGVTGENLGATGLQGTTGGYTEGGRTGGFREGTHTGYGNEGFSSTTHGRTGVSGTTSGPPGQGQNLNRSEYGQPGPAPNTAGPHKSDALNKADPRVDSNLDGSKTYGGDKTFDQGTTAHKDPRDATQVPPSVMQKHIGKPVAQHEDASHGSERRL